MTKISKGEGPPDPGQGRRVEGVGKSSGPGRGTAPGPGTGSAADGLPAGSGSAGEGRARSPHRIDLADGGGRWADLIVPSPAPSAEVAAAAEGLGGEFDTLAYAGRGGARFAMEEKVPPGYVLVEFARTGPGYFDLGSVDWDGREAVALGDSSTSRRFERRVMWCDNLYPLRFRVRCDDRAEWVIVIRSVRAVRALGTAATGRGSEVLLHTGPAGGLVTRLHAAKGSLRVEGHKPRRPHTPATSPAVLASVYERPYEDVRALPEGPLLVAVLDGDGDWPLEVGELPEPRPRKGLWARLFGRQLTRPP
ncbi:hypothetical protein [Streptomyces roseolus]|uniref:hypothetical protein n=1 Tax=Streptomyces roseolus TaxID=67358 RepID=UPI00167472F9|nr:hypothetical protein [Streptomyces roseolus]GGR30858.1 hypothetical protein GCM10010282_24070 [Streptomyces roseolus]